MPMVTYADLFQFCMLIAAIVGLVQHNLVLYDLRWKEIAATTCNSDGWPLKGLRCNIDRAGRMSLSFPFFFLHVYYTILNSRR